MRENNLNRIHETVHRWIKMKYLCLIKNDYKRTMQKRCSSN